MSNAKDKDAVFRAAMRWYLDHVGAAQGYALREPRYDLLEVRLARACARASKRKGK